MKIIKEKTEKICKMDLELEKDEEKLLLKYFKKHGTAQDLKNMKMEWSFIKMMEEFVKSVESA